MKKLEQNTPDIVLKIKTVGDSGVGKTALIKSFIEGKFSADTQPTIGVEYKSHIIQVLNKNVKISLWDTAGQERFRTVTSNYYKGSNGLVFVFDITRKDTFENIQSWLKEAEQNIPENQADKIVKMLISNKIDLEEDRQITKLEAENFARENKMLFVETSAKTLKGISEAFHELAAKILEMNPISEIISGTKIDLKETPNKTQGNQADPCSSC